MSSVVISSDLTHYYAFYTNVKNVFYGHYKNVFLFTSEVLKTKYYVFSMKQRECIITIY